METVETITSRQVLVEKYPKTVKILVDSNEGVWYRFLSNEVFQVRNCDEIKKDNNYLDKYNLTELYVIESLIGDDEWFLGTNYQGYFILKKHCVRIK